MQYVIERVRPRNPWYRQRQPFQETAKASVPFRPVIRESCFHSVQQRSLKDRLLPFIWLPRILLERRNISAQHSSTSRRLFAEPLVTRISLTQVNFCKLQIILHPLWLPPPFPNEKKFFLRYLRAVSTPSLLYQRPCTFNASTQTPTVTSLRKAEHSRHDAPSFHSFGRTCGRKICLWRKGRRSGNEIADNATEARRGSWHSLGNR